jgi:DNA repair protein RecO
MSRESTYNAIILKLQPFGEADEIITFYTSEAGKVRALAKSVKLPTSRLRQALQPMFFIEVTIAGSTKLPKVIRSTIRETYQNILADSQRLSRWFVAAELIMRATADEQKNPELFLLLQDFLRFMNREDVSTPALDAALIKFKIELLAYIGLGLWQPADQAQAPGFFSNSRGGFINTRLSNDAVPVDQAAWESFQKIKAADFNQLSGFSGPTDKLQPHLSSFLEYQLEREIKSERFIVPPNL